MKIVNYVEQEKVLNYVMRPKISALQNSGNSNPFSSKETQMFMTIFKTKVAVFIIETIFYDSIHLLGISH